MEATKLRRTVALFSSAALLASLTMVTIAAPTSAAAFCDGKPATIQGGGLIEGTSGDDVIVGSDGEDQIFGKGGKDTICGRKGNDGIDGGGNRDRIFGGGGDDVIVGGPGRDDLFGFKGDDFIRGQGGNDFINGGQGTDNCGQGPGSGRIRNCEKADLRVKVTGPAEASAGTVTFKVKVRNRGPNRTSYSYQLDEENQDATCDGPQPWETIHVFGRLRPGATRTRTYQVTCTVNDAGAWVEVKAFELTPAARDPRIANNEDKARTDLIQ